MKPKQTLGAPGDLSGFPTTNHRRALVRVCQRKFGTWFFCSDGSGRFDLEAPEGTCYFATDEYAAIREASRLGPVSMDWVRARDLRRVPPPIVRLADTTHRSAGRYGLTNELVTLIDYTLPRLWAAAFRRARMDGIRHLLRHDQRGGASGVSLFGAAGAQSRPDGAKEPLTPQRVRAAGVDVLEPPRSSLLEIID